MIQKLKEWSGVIALLAIIVLVSLQDIGLGVKFGTAAPSGSISYYTALGTQYGLYIGTYGNSTQVIDDSGNFSTAGTATVGTFTQGGGITASSTSAASLTLAGTEFTTSNVLDYTINVGSVTLTLAASTTAPCSVMSAGQTRQLFIRNATTTATSNLTIAGGTGTALKRTATSSPATIFGDTDGSNFGIIQITKKASTDCIAIFTASAD